MDPFIRGGFGSKTNGSEARSSERVEGLALISADLIHDLIPTNAEGRKLRRLLQSHC